MFGLTKLSALPSTLIAQVLREYAPKYDEVQETQAPEVHVLSSWIYWIRDPYMGLPHVSIRPTAHPSTQASCTYKHITQQGTHQSGVFVAEGHEGGGRTKRTEPSSRTAGQGSGSGSGVTGGDIGAGPQGQQKAVERR